MTPRYFPSARTDIKGALKWSAENFGHAAYLRSKKLLSIAIAEIEANPELDHSYEVSALQAGIRLYHTKHSRQRAAVDGQIVRKPRHFVAYWVLGGDAVIVRVLHERMELARQLEKTL